MCLLFAEGGRMPLFPRAFWVGHRCATVLFLGLLSVPAWAIPSPDLLINFSASAAQLLGVLSVMVGGVAYSAGNKPGYRTERRQSWRWVFRGAWIGLLVSVSLNIFQYTRQVDEENRRLRLNLIRGSVEEGKQVGDVSLKTLSFSQQLQHPLGVSTQQLARWLNTGRPLNLIDIREPEEVEKGRIAGSWHIRYPDLRRHPEKLLKPGARTVLMCFSGNRSSELCEEFNRQGYACNFVVGGYEKWIAENRPLAMANGRSPKELRDLPDFPNKTVLLKTDEVIHQITDNNALFVDVRYPGDFERGHLPGAVNLPIRMLPSGELEAKLKALPKNRPIIAPCYDKRSCFYAQILGIRLSRLGYEFLGRYSLPHEFFLPKAAKAHVAQWIKARQGRSLLDWVAGPLEAGLLKLRASLGSLVAGIAVVVLILRLAFMPWTLKAERDQLMQRRLKEDVSAIKQRFKDDEPQANRSILKLYRRHGLTPGRNMAVSLAQIIIFLVLFQVVQRVAEQRPEAFLWIQDLGQPDPTRILPAAVGVALFGYLMATASKRNGRWTILYGVFAAAIGALAWHLNAAVNGYLLFTIVLISLHGFMARWRFRREREPEKTPPSAFPEPAGQDPGIVPLSKAHFYRGSGNKAIRLGQMMSAGLPVPDGFVLTDTLLGTLEKGKPWPQTMLSKMRHLYRRLWCEQVAVRSSGVNEDGAQQSYAGVFESKLGVKWDDLQSAIGEIRGSFTSGRAGAYAGNQEEPGGIVVQKMVPAEYAGVLFTEHPTTTGCMLVEMITGVGEALVSGAATPKGFRFGRLSGQLWEDQSPPIDLKPLLALGRRVEALYGRPQDIEWAYAQGKFYLLQARDITVSIADRDSVEAERRRILDMISVAGGGDPVLIQNELSELLPRPTPLSLSLMERLWAPGGSTDMACRILGIPYDVDEDSPPMLVTCFGALYINQEESRRRSGKGPGAATAFRLSRGAQWIERDFREHFLPRFRHQMRLHEALDLGVFSRDELLTLLREWTEAFVTETYVQAEVINVAADFYWKTASRQLTREGLAPACYLVADATTVVQQAMEMLPEIREGKRNLEDFLGLFGHRAPNDYELSQPRYREDASMVEALLGRAGRHSSASSPPLPAGKVLRMTVDRARRFQVLKEEAKHDCLRQLANLRLLLVEIGQRFGLGDEIFYLSLSEVLKLKHRQIAENALGLAAERIIQAQQWHSMSLPAKLSVRKIETLGLDIQLTKESTSELSGIRVAGEGDIVGPVQVIRNPGDIDTFREGHILVARFTDPTWTPLFARAKGLITEVGGWLSHAAIVAREYNLTAIVGAEGSTRLLNDGEVVHLSGDGRIKKISDRRRERRVPTGLPLRVIQGGKVLQAKLSDLSRSGARIQGVAGLHPGETLDMGLDILGKTVSAEVVRKTDQGELGLRFLQPLPELPLEALSRQAA